MTWATRPLAAGVRFLPLTVLAFIVAPIAGKLTVRIQSRYLLGSGLFLIAVGCCPDGHHQRRFGLDGAAPRLHRGRHRHRHGQPGAGVLGHLGGATRAQRDGLGGQQHLPPGGDRHRHRRAGLGLPVPAPEPYPARAPQHLDRSGACWPTAGRPSRVPSSAGRSTEAAAAAPVRRRPGPPCSRPTGPASRPPSTRSWSSARSSP